MNTEASNFLNHELFNLVCGDVLGSGVARTVYEHRFDPTVVLKFEGTRGSFQNVLEWETWQSVKHSNLAHWFAPCIAISPNGAVLVQRRTTPPRNYPDLIPAFFTDTKLTNFGMLVPEDADGDFRGEGGQFVCHDYGLHLLLEKGLTKRMRKADWWNL